jgi:K+-transporting ATPase ATPase C chain
MKALSIAVRMCLVTLVLTGLAYPLLVTGLAQLLFPTRANGSLVADESGRIVGSELIAQPFSGDAYVHPRPSAVGWDAAGSGGSNLGPTSGKLVERAGAEAARLGGERVPADLVTASASGLDPHLTPQGASFQLARVAAARGVSIERVRQVLEAHVEGRDLGFLGEPRVNVLRLNLALDRHFGRPVTARK